MKRSIALAASALALAAPATVQPHSGLGLSLLAQVGTVDERFLSYNVEMVEVTGGRFWAPYGGPPGEMYRMRPPENLADPKLRGLARYIGPSYMRVSGTWANFTYLEADGEKLEKPPEGYEQILTRDQWRGVIDFARAADAKLGVSYAVSTGPRGPDGAWKTDQAQRLHDLTTQSGGEIAWSEFINEPNAASMGHLPQGYSTEDYTRDLRIFREWAAKSAPGMTIVGPGGVGEGALDGDIPVAMPKGMLRTEELMKASPNSVDVVSYHFYGGVSQRCKNVGAGQADKAAALTWPWLDLSIRDWRYYARLRDKYEPGDPMWVTETAQAACGGSPWGSTFLDTFRYLNQLGLYAQKGVKAVFHNTLAASDYALIDQESRVPRPNYWAAVLWRRTMGTTVLASPASPSTDMRLYAHCLPGRRGGVGVLAINTGMPALSLAFDKGATSWTMMASPLDSGSVSVNGKTPSLDAQGMLTGLEGAPVNGSVAVPGQSIVFVTVPGANNRVCR
ncbi:MAG: hypothetical protein AB7F98_19570 [Novosphingobium sp.]